MCAENVKDIPIKISSLKTLISEILLLDPQMLGLPCRQRARKAAMTGKRLGGKIDLDATTKLPPKTKSGRGRESEQLDTNHPVREASQTNST
jgi:hypothetical protein